MFKHIPSGPELPVLVMRHGLPVIATAADVPGLLMQPLAMPGSTLQQHVNEALRRVSAGMAAWLMFYDGYVGGGWPRALVVGTDAYWLHPVGSMEWNAYEKVNITMDSGEILERVAAQLIAEVPAPVRHIFKPNGAMM